MEKYFPASFSEVLAGILVFFAIVSAALSLFTCLRAHTLRLLAIFFVTALALFSNNVTTYFVAIFVIATAVTELEFLQNLAAIVRGNKEYFDYKKETLSKEEKLHKLTAEVAQTAVVVESDVSSSSEEDSPKENNPLSSQEQANKSVDETVSATDIEGKETADNNEAPKKSVGFKPGEVINISELGNIKINLPETAVTYRVQSPDVRRIYELEGKAFDSLEMLYEKAIERGVSLRGGNTSIQLDGLLTSSDGKDIIFEVKYLSSSHNFLSWIRLVGSQLERIVSRYKDMTGKLNTKMHFVLILEEGVKLTARQQAALKDMKCDDVSVFTTDFLMSVAK
jgi:hypothetical protein